VQRFPTTYYPQPATDFSLAFVPYRRYSSFAFSGNNLLLL